MDAATIALLVIVGVIVAAIALHLIAIASSLARIGGTLGKVRGGVQAIAGQTAPINEVVGGLAADVSAIDDDLEGLLQLVGEAQAKAAAAAVAVPPPPPARRRAPSPGRTATAAAVLDVVDMEDLDGEPAVPRISMREAVAHARTR